MKPNKRQKLCQNCEGSVDLDVIVCPFCAADLREEKPEQAHPPYSASSSVRTFDPKEKMQQSLYPPPYSPRESEEPLPSSAQAIPAEEKSILLPTLLLALGMQLFLIGVLLFLFSHHGVVLLKWNATLWFLYFFASAPFLILGYKALSKLK